MADGLIGLVDLDSMPGHVLESRRNWIVVVKGERRISECAGGWVRGRSHCPTTRMVVSSRGGVCGGMPEPAPGVGLRRSCTRSWDYRGSRLGR